MNRGIMFVLEIVIAIRKKLIDNRTVYLYYKNNLSYEGWFVVEKAM